MRTSEATRYVTPLREGGSLPAIVEADDLGLSFTRVAKAQEERMGFFRCIGIAALFASSAEAVVIQSGYYDLYTAGQYSGIFNIALSDGYRLSGFGGYDGVYGGTYSAAGAGPVQIGTPLFARLNDAPDGAFSGFDNGTLHLSQVILIPILMSFGSQTFVFNFTAAGTIFTPVDRYGYGIGQCDLPTPDVPADLTGCHESVTGSGTAVSTVTFTESLAGGFTGSRIPAIPLPPRRQLPNLLRGSCRRSRLLP